MSHLISRRPRSQASDHAPNAAAAWCAHAFFDRGRANREDAGNRRGAGIFLDVQVVVLKRWQFTNVVNTRHNRFLRL